MSDEVTSQRDGPVLVITMQRPEARNAMTREAAARIEALVDELDSDDGLRIGILTGAGGTFCAGMDLKRFAARGERPVTTRRGFGGFAMVPPIKPMIAAVEGYALAGGFELVLACDLVVAADDATFGLPEVTRGLLAGGGGALRLAERIPYHLAMELLLTGAPLGAIRARELGLVNRLVPRGRALAEARALAAAVLANGPLAVAGAKRILVESRDWSRAEMFERQQTILDAVGSSADAREGARAFAEKRPPVWRGE